MGLGTPIVAQLISLFGLWSVALEALGQQWMD